MDILSKTAYLLNKAVVPVSRVLYVLGVSFFVIMVVLVVVNVISRYVFKLPIPGSFELVEKMFGIMAAWGFAYCAVEKGHVRIDLLVGRLPQRTQVIMESFVGLLASGLLFLMSWLIIEFVIEMFGSGQKTSDLGLPVYFIVALVAVGLIVFCLVVIAQFLESLSKAVRR